MRFPALYKMSNTQVRILLCKFSSAFVTSDYLFDVFKDVIKRINNTNEEVDFYKDIVDANELSRLIEWLLITVAKCVANKYKEVEENCIEILL